MLVEILYSIILNMSVLLLFAQLITRAKQVQNFIVNQKKTLKGQLILVAFFGTLGIFATLSGVTINNAIVNVRTIAIVSAGILFGPFVGIGAGIIAGFHRLFLAGNDFTSLACAISTLLGSVVGSYFHKEFKTKINYLKIIIIVALTEATQMIIIVLLASPFEQAVELVSMIAIPMILINSVGVALFISVFESAFTSVELYSAQKVALVLDIADKCLPYLRKGLNDVESLEKASKIILDRSSSETVAIANSENILVLNSKLTDTKYSDVTYILNIVKEKNIRKTYLKVLGNKTYVVGCLFKKDLVIGYLITSIPKSSFLIKPKIEFVDGLAKLMSTQLELSQIEQSRQELKKMELDMLESQINPHFLFNVLNTIISISRYDINKSRELLMDLSVYFRNVLKKEGQVILLSEEINNVYTYFSLEKARFESRLVLNINNQSNLDVYVPHFIIQPLVENAIKHGLKGCDCLIISVNIYLINDDLVIDVEDNGVGISDDVKKAFYENKLDKRSIGLNNVYLRLERYYGKNYGLTIDNDTNSGSKLTIKIPYKERLDENSNN